MYQFWAIFISLVFSVSVFSRVDIIKQEGATFYDFADLSVETQDISINGQEFLKARLIGAEEFEAIKFELGRPEIPVVRFYAPAGKLEVTFDDTKAAQDVTRLTKDLVPNLESLEKIPGSKRKLFIDKSIQKSNHFYPGKTYESIPAGSIDGQAMQLITVYPINWNPVTKTYRLTENFSVLVKHSNQKNLSKPEQVNQTFAFIIGSTFKNSPSIAKYENFKRDLGYNVVRINVEGSINNPEAIRAKLQELYRTTNLKYAIIFGDAEHVPAIRATSISGVTDHYYRAIDTDNYASDINGPDIGVGRVTIKNEQELSRVIDKFIKYQTATFSNDSWLKNISFIATNDRYEVAEGSHNFAVDTYTAPRGYQGIFPNPSQLGGDKLYAITYRVRDDQVVDAMKLGRTIINYSGHGATEYWAGPNVTQNDVRSLNHSDALPFVISNACITGQFTVNESFGETWIKHPQGAIMFWGSMDSTYWDEDDFLERDMYRGIYDLNKSNFAEITHYALSELWRRYGGENRSKYYWETYVTFGDPSIRLMTDAVKNISLEGPQSIALGTSSVDYTLTYENGSPLANTSLTLIQDGNLIAYTTTNNEGNASLNLPENMIPGSYKLRIYGINTGIVEKDFTVILDDKPFLVLNNITINGQADLKVNPFQSINFNLIAKNVARRATEGAKIMIDKIDGAAIVEGSKEISIPGLDQNSTYHYQGTDLKVRIQNALNQERIVVHFKWITNEGQDGYGKVALMVKRGLASVTSIDFGDAQNPDEGGIRPGNSGDIFLTVKNTGDATMESINLYPEVNSCIETIDGAVFIDKLAPGESIRFNQPLYVTLKPGCSNNQLATFNLVGHYGTCTQIDLNNQSSFTIGKSTTFKYERNTHLDIPDNNVLTFPFAIEGNVDIIRNISVHVKITHPYIGDLVLTLIHPDGTNIILRNQSGSSADNIDEIYGIGGTSVPDLEKLKGKSAKGDWKLLVSDRAGSDVGTLDYFKITIKGLMD